jgi:hypothetical protein
MSGTTRLSPVAGVAIAGLAVAALAVTGCGGYYYRAVIQGFVIDDETGGGINGATVRIYTRDVETADADGYVAQTATVTQGGNAGYYSSTVIWRQLFGSYGLEGDTTTIWVAVTHPDYAPVVVAASGILSDDSNLIGSIRLVQTTFSIPALRGRVEDANGSGVNGVRVVLDLPAVTGTDLREDRVTQTATIDGTPGRFEFAPVDWSDRHTTDPAGEVTAVVRIDDPDWGGQDVRIIERDVVLVPSNQTRTMTDPIPVYRQPRTEFSTIVEGRLVERILDGGGSFVEERPVEGVRVELRYWRRTDAVPDPDPDDPDPAVADPFRVLVDHTDAQGVYRFAVSWTDLAPGDFDHADVRTDPALGGDTTGIAPGEDGLLVDITYADAAVPGGVLAFSTADGWFRIHSNPRGGINRLPAVIRSAP